MRKLSLIFILLVCYCLGNMAQQANGGKIDNLEYYIQNKKIGLRDKTTKKLIVPCKYEYIGRFSKTGLASVKREGLCGYVNSRATEVIMPQYQAAYYFAENGIAAVKKNGKWGYINNSGTIKIPFTYDEAKSFNEGLAIVKKGDKWGAINSLGKIVIPLKYEEFRSFTKGGTANVKMSGKWGLIDRKGKQVVACLYDKEFSLNEEGYASVVRDGKTGIVYKDGNETAECVFEGAGSLAEGLLCVKQGDKYGFIDYWGKLVIPCRYKSSQDFKNGIVGESIDDISVILAKDTRTIATLPGKYANLYRIRNHYTPFSGDLFVHFKDTENGFKEGLVDGRGKYILPCIYDKISIFIGDGLIAVKKTDKYGFVDAEGNLKISYQYDDTGYHFQEGLVPVKKGEKWGVIDKNASTIVPFKYEEISQYASFSRVKLNDKWGLMDRTGATVLNCIYDEVGYPNTTFNYVSVKLNGKEGYCDFYGNSTL